MFKIKNAFFSLMLISVLTSNFSLAECPVPIRLFTRGPISENLNAREQLIEAIRKQGYKIVQSKAESVFTLAIDSEIEQPFIKGFTGHPAVVRINLYRNETQELEWSSLWAKGQNIFPLSNRPSAWARRARKSILDHRHGGPQGLPTCGSTYEFVDGNNVPVLKPAHFY